MRNHELLNMALVGYKTERQRIETTIAEIKRQLDGRIVASAAEANPPRRMSAAGRRRIAAAQRARWAKQKAATAPAPKKAKRKMSAATKAKLVANLKKARAARAAKRKAGEKVPF